MSGELVVGGVFLRLFIANSSWQVRHPKQFATELLERLLDCMAKPDPELEIVTKAFVALVVNHPTIADQVSVFFCYACLYNKGRVPLNYWQCN